MRGAGYKAREPSLFTSYSLLLIYFERLKQAVYSTDSLSEMSLLLLAVCKHTYL